uniref:Uncharacterized protein n=1 Tax=Anguilla anguilla TaxID=7936 RepID=A0A0E9W9T9_ANGAN
MRLKSSKALLIAKTSQLNAETFTKLL